MAQSKQKIINNELEQLATELDIQGSSGYPLIAKRAAIAAAAAGMPMHGSKAWAESFYEGFKNLDSDHSSITRWTNEKAAKDGNMRRFHQAAAVGDLYPTMMAAKQAAVDAARIVKGDKDLDSAEVKVARVIEGTLRDTYAIAEKIADGSATMEDYEAEITAAPKRIADKERKEALKKREEKRDHGVGQALLKAAKAIRSVMNPSGSNAQPIIFSGEQGANVHSLLAQAQLTLLGGVVADGLISVTEASKLTLKPKPDSSECFTDSDVVQARDAMRGVAGYKPKEEPAKAPETPAPTTEGMDIEKKLGKMSKKELLATIMKLTAE